MDWITSIAGAVQSVFSGGATFGISEILKAGAALVIVFAGYFINKWVNAWYQRWLDFKDKQDQEEARLKAEADRKKFSDSVRGPRDNIP